MGFRHLGGLGGGSGFLILVTVGSYFGSGMVEAGVSCRATAGSTGRRAGLPGELPAAAAVSAGQAGWLAKVMTASAIRVAVSVRLACPKVLGHFALRARCRFRSMTVRSLPSALVRAA